ncbi:hypothetical protein I33_3444 [Bacillus subtilis subsp. subtilis str. RO-NN-1]|nr:hypothetical protein I33_3444 [Bacillus subtilis subsp. subtilis str. RO-NN-1]
MTKSNRKIVFSKPNKKNPGFEPGFFHTVTSSFSFLIKS